jgi:hypothetical protein
MVLTGWIILIAITLLVVFDSWAYATKRAPTLSRYVHSLGAKYPLLLLYFVLLLGVLIGHAFFPVK